MSHSKSVKLVLLVFIASCAGSFAADEKSAVHRGQVVSVHDGDSLTLLVGDEKVKIRLAQIDAPELKQPYGPESRSALVEMVANRKVRAEVISETGGAQVPWENSSRVGAGIYLGGS